jgi:hypothetical protein
MGEEPFQQPDQAYHRTDGTDHPKRLAMDGLCQSYLHLADF